MELAEHEAICESIGDEFKFRVIGHCMDAENGLSRFNKIIHADCIERALLKCSLEIGPGRVFTSAKLIEG